MPRSRRRPPPTPRKQPVQRRAAFTVDAIIIAVERILEDTGPDALTTNRIAEVAGVSVGTLYQYYPNKEALIAAVHQRYLDGALAACRAVLATADTVPLSQVPAQIGLALFDLYRHQRRIHRWLADLRTDAGFQDRYRVAMDTFTTDTAEFLERRTGLGAARTGAAAFAVVHAIQGLLAAIGDRPDHDHAAIGAETVRMIAGYLDALTASS